MTAPDVIVGIDPGLKGGLSCLWVSCNGTVIDSDAVPYDIGAYHQTIALAKNNYLNPIVAIEQVHSMPKQGVASTFKFGEQFGILKGLCMGLGVKFITIAPQEWKRGMGLLHQDKSASISLAKKLFPGANLRPSARCRKDSDGMAESLLIAEYARRKLCGS